LRTSLIVPRPAAASRHVDSEAIVQSKD
jgi:hypothetical protein